MCVAVGLILAAFGAILTWAVDAQVNGLNVTAVGVILMVIGILVIVLDLLWWRSWTWYASGPAWDRRTYVRDAAAPGYPMTTAAPTRRGRRVVVDEEVGGPPMGPPPP